MDIDFTKELICIEAEKVRKWAIKANDGSDNLTNWCTICSYLIFKKLDKVGLEPEFCSINIGVGSHCFVYCQGYIVDVTATQFKVKTDIVIRKNQGKHKLYFWNLRSAYRMRSLERIENHLESWADICHPKKRFQQKRIDRREAFERRIDSLCA